MSTEIQPFKMEDVQRRVSDTIKSQFAMMIPDEAFEAMARNAIKDFFETEKMFPVVKTEVRNQNSSYGTHPEYSLNQFITPFKYMLWEEFRQITEQKLKEWLAGEQDKLRAAVKEMFENNHKLKGALAENVEQLCVLMAAAQQRQILENAFAQVQVQFQQFAAINNLRTNY